MSARTTLVTGATGLVGHAIVQGLREQGHTVRVLARDAARARTVVPPGTEIVQGDVTDPASLPRAMEGIEWLFHAAGMPEQWQRDDGIFDRVNRQGTRHVLESALRAGVKRAIYTSTMDVFEKGPDGRLVETHLDPNPKHTVYERSKVAAEREADEVRARGLDVVYVNPSSVYGPSPVHVSINTLFIRLLNRKVPLLPPGGVSVVYVDGVARAHLAAAERGRSGERYLLADAHLSVAELAREICRQGGLSRVPPTGPTPLLKLIATISAPLARTFGFEPLIAPGQLTFLLWDAAVDASKACRELAFVPLPLAEGVARTIAALRAGGLVPGAGRP